MKLKYLAILLLAFALGCAGEDDKKSDKGTDKPEDANSTVKKEADENPAAEKELALKVDNMA